MQINNWHIHGQRQKQFQLVHIMHLSTQNRFQQTKPAIQYMEYCIPVTNSVHVREKYFHKHTFLQTHKT